MENENLNGNETDNQAPQYEAPGVSYAPPSGYVTFVPYGFTPKTYEEKKGIRKKGMMIGLSFIIQLFISTFWAVGYYFVMKRLGFTTLKAQQIITEPAALQVAQIVLSVLLFTLPYVVIFKSFGVRIGELMSFKKPERKTALPLFFLGTAFCAFANVATSQASRIFENFGIDYNVDFGEDPKGFFGFCLAFISTVIVPAMVEEFALRGIVLGTLRKFGDGFAILASAILFGLMHGNFEQMPFAFIIGIILGFVTVKTGSLLVSMAIHGFNNFISVAFSYFLGSVSQSAQNVIYTLVLMALMLAGIVSLLFLENQNELFTLRPSDTESRLSKKMKWFFTSPCIIIFTVFCLLESLQFFM